MIYILLIPLSIWQYNQKSALLQQKIDIGKPLTVIEKSGIYGLNILIGLGSYIVFPEVAKETLFLMFPDKDKTKVFHNAAFLKSEHIQDQIKKKKKGKVVWNMSRISHKELRYALAYNPCIIETIHLKDYKEVILMVPISYPKKSSTVIGGH
ncbi:MAG: hypothetical protein WBP45_09370 [Daejeonella sp.]